MLRAFLALVLAITALPAAAQSVVVSEKAENVSITIYRAPNRGERPINKNWPQGYALITETRNVRIPAGESIIRFEGVSEGMFPESAIVTGLPQGVSEKNRDARLLSPAGLVDAYLKREVTIRRTNKASGKVTESKAIITTGPNGVVLDTDNGFEALSCSGLPERMVYGQVPNNLSAKPTLSVVTQSDRATTAELTLTYMSGGFDWQANYLVQMKGDAPFRLEEGDTPRDKASLFAWLTVANGGNQSFENANMMAVAGEPNRERRGAEPRPTGGALQLKCWPIKTTSDIPYRALRQFPGAIPPPPMALAAYAEENMDTVIVTASKASGKARLEPVAAIKAEQENLGDLKLYRVPERVNVKAKGQKQVAMITQPGALFERLFTADVDDYDEDSAAMAIMLRGKNEKKDGLGLPMPSGQVQIFEPSNFGPLLAGEATLDDRAVKDEIELIVGTASDVRMKVVKLSERGRKQKWRVTLSNARMQDAQAEIEIPYELSRRSNAIRKVDGVPTWRGIIPAGDEISFTYTVKLAKG